MNTTINHRRTTYALTAGWLLFWLLMIAVAIQDYLRNGGTRIWEPLLWEGSSAVVVSILIVVHRWLVRSHDHLLHRPARWFMAQLAWLPVMCVSFVVLAYGIRHVAYSAAGQVYRHGGWDQVLIQESIKITLFFSIFMAVLFGILSYRELALEKERAERAAALLRQAQLQRLVQQLQPHFLFNALNTVSSLMHTDVARADAMLARLSEVLRSTLDLSEQVETEVRHELKYLRSYAQLMLERFSDRVQFDWDIGSDVLECRIPAMSLQPLLENTFKHTVEQRSKPVQIRISVRREGESLVLRIEDDIGCLAPREHAGVGTKNLRDRLAALHGERAHFELIQLEPAGVRSEMRLPCVF